MANLLAAADVDLVVVVLRGLAVNRVVEVHALGVSSPPVAPHQVSSGTQQTDDHCGKDRNYGNDNAQNCNGYIATKEKVITSSSSAVREVAIGLLYTVAVSDGC